MALKVSRSSRQRGSILLPVIVLLLLLATAATAMTIQARTSLREAATRRDRLVSAMTADAAVRATALAMATAASAQAAPPFGLDGRPQSCRLAGGRVLQITVQDQGGLVDLNKGSLDLLHLVLTRAGLGGGEATALLKLVEARRNSEAPHLPPTVAPRTPQKAAAPPQVARDFVSVDELSDMPGLSLAGFERLRPLLTTANRSAGIDPQVAAPALRALIPPKELTSASFEAMSAPSRHSDFIITAVVASGSGQRFGRRASFRLDADAGPLGRFVAWDALAPVDLVTDESTSQFCDRVVEGLSPG
ncbi:type II secretion system protein GspK [Lichenihabitans sp. Uapishka_5]|uniref:type II secretion system protein GspK n=1 Tax=Lichenihabitans sp. Uapishka_5 TaxID=3037302 RepID=UPI0029E80000|nr:type II secretion system protein GspK [Lichenihabitans sp. Uapishka_5]MDX7952698.1 type II secretion system protein GspK [Lichenihabitans sp. Uapishka_5]